MVDVNQFVGLQLNLRYNKEFFSEQPSLKSALEFRHSTFQHKGNHSAFSSEFIYLARHCGPIFS
jgi:hypothetical protein